MLCPLCLSSSERFPSGKAIARDGGKQYGKCCRCGLIFLERPFHPSPADEKARYDHHENDPRDPRYLGFLEKLAGPLRPRLKAGWKGLDFGCGPGPAFGEILRSSGVSVSCYDPYYYPDPAVLDEKYDFIVSTEVLEHFREPRREFLVLDRLMKGEGSCLAVMTGILERDEDFDGWWYAKDPTHLCFYRKATFEWIAQWLGWEAEFPERNVVLCMKHLSEGASSGERARKKSVIESSVAQI